MKQTAVEFLVEQITNSTMPVRKAIEQAKEMEKEQIVEAHGNKLKKSKDTTNYEYWFSGEDYYNKAFKKTDK
jgi:flavorubredoxin